MDDLRRNALKYLTETDDEFEDDRLEILRLLADAGFFSAVGHSAGEVLRSSADLDYYDITGPELLAACGLTEAKPKRFVARVVLDIEVQDPDLGVKPPLINSITMDRVINAINAGTGLNVEAKLGYATRLTDKPPAEHYVRTGWPFEGEKEDLL